MLPKRFRVWRDKDIKRLLKSRYSYATPNLRIVIHRRTDDDGFRVMGIVGKKYYKRAHDRIKLKRRILATISKLHVADQLPKNLDCSIQVRSKTALLTPYSELEPEIQSGLAKVFGRLR